MREILPLPFALAAALYLPLVQDEKPKPSPQAEEPSSRIEKPASSERPSITRWHPRALALLGPPIAKEEIAPAATDTPVEPMQGPPVAASEDQEPPQRPDEDPGPSTPIPSTDEPTTMNVTLEENELRVLQLRRQLQEAQERLEEARRSGPRTNAQAGANTSGSALEGTPPHPLARPSHEHLARAYARLGKDAEAREHWLLVDSPWAALRAAECLERLDRGEEALREYESIRKRFAEHEAGREARLAADHLRWRSELLQRFSSLGKRLEVSR